MSDDETPAWMKPSPALKRIAEAKEPEIQPMTSAEKRAVVLPGQVVRGDIVEGEGTGGEKAAMP